MTWTTKIKASLASALGLQVVNAPGAGIRVLAPGCNNLFVTEHDDGRGHTVLQVAYSAGQSAVVLLLDGKESTVAYFKNSSPAEKLLQEPPDPIEARRWMKAQSDRLLYTPGSETLALQLYGQIKQSIVGGAPASGRVFQAAGRLVLWLLAATALIMIFTSGSGKPAVAAVSAYAPSPEIAQIQGQRVAQAAAAAAAQPAPSGERIPADARASAQERAAIESLKGVIKIGASGKPFYVFTDPNCPFCKQFEKTIENVPTGYQAIIIPLGYKDGSKATTAGVLCSANPAAEWRRAMSQGPSPALKACERGERLTQENMQVFESLRLNRTPTILTPANLLVSGAASPDELVTILGAGLQ